MTTQTLNFKIDSQLKLEFNQLARDLGITTSALLNLFIKRAVDEHGIPFEVKVSNRPKRFDELNPILQKMWIEDKAIEMGLIEDDSTEISEKDFEEWRSFYK
ncbi:MAG: type II toxin-antitoxin system RelB/DinJ family antitoxin [Streptococcaceae bacterium]|jgi:DNA-damage-inducible protein J|nr:type II toxin-antitoxin system RelB/DinJ family antitoxin [Streptococcaceae bacterium]